MSTYWDKQAVNLVNSTTMNLTVQSVGILEHGEWDVYPSSGVAAGQTLTPAFVTRSLNASEVGPGPGTVQYLLPDGTTLTISFDMIFAVYQTSFVQAVAGGPRAPNYNVAIECSQDSWHGQGKRFEATVTLTASAGSNSVICSKS